MTKMPDPYRGFRFPAEIIAHAVWLYHGFSLSRRDVETILAQRGIVVSCESIRAWGLRFGRAFANALKRRRPQPGDKWHLDEVLILSAKSGGLDKSGEGVYPCLGARQPVQPADHPRDVHPDRDTGLLKPRLCQPDVAAPAHPEGTHALRECALHPGPPVVTLLPGGIVHPCPRRVQRLVLLAQMEMNGATGGGGVRSALATQGLQSVRLN